MKPLRLVFMGTPEFAAQHLEALTAHPEFELAAVYTQPDKPKGRSSRPSPTPVKEAALQKGLPVIQVSTLKTEAEAARLRSFAPDIAIVIAFGLILPDSILSVPSYGCVNIHPSLLPKYRGASPIQYTLLNGEKTTGVTSILMDSGIDSGPILLQKPIPVSLQDDYGSLTGKLILQGKECLVETLMKIRASGLTFRGLPQEGETSVYAGKITKEMAVLDFSQPAFVLHNQIRALEEWPGCKISMPAADGEIHIKIVKAEPLPGISSFQIPGEIISDTRTLCQISTGDGIVNLLEVQPEGKKRMPVRAFLNGYKILAGKIAAGIL
jgi:methionyl-tRNA formyltransferase